MIEPAVTPKRRIECGLAGMSEGRMAKIVREAERLGQVFIEPERARDRAADLRDFQAVGQANAEMIAIGRDEYLRLVAQSPKRNRVNDAITIALESCARSARFADWFEMTPTERRRRVARPAGVVIHLAAIFATSCPASLA